MKPTRTSSPSPLMDKPTQRLPLTQQHPASSPEPRPSPVQGWMLSPQRLFLGGTFVYAGMQKLTDPQFFHKATPGYIGNQIIAFAQGSPLHLFLVKVALPHAVLFGWTVALGEVAIGLGTLFGLLFRPAALFGLMLSLLFFLTASWHVYPYFYGADIVFAWSWLTLLLAGPVGTGLPTGDQWLQRVVFPQGLAQKRAMARLLGVCVLGMNSWRGTEPAPLAKGSHQQRFVAGQQRREKRRAFLQGVATGGAGIVALALASSVLHLFGRPGTTPTNGAAGSATPGGSSGSTGTPIAQVSAVPENSAVTFTLPSTGDPGVLIHLPGQQFVAFDATCTHAGCEVGYDPSSGHLICPCHGAQFDPEHQAAVLQGPAQLPLAPVKIHVDPASGSITLE